MFSDEKVVARLSSCFLLDAGKALMITSASPSNVLLSEFSKSSAILEAPPSAKLVATTLRLIKTASFFVMRIFNRTTWGLSLSLSINFPSSKNLWYRRMVA